MPGESHEHLRLLVRSPSCFPSLCFPFAMLYISGPSPGLLLVPFVSVCFFCFASTSGASLGRRWLPSAWSLLYPLLPVPRRAALRFVLPLSPLLRHSFFFEQLRLSLFLSSPAAPAQPSSRSSVSLENVNIACGAHVPLPPPYLCVIWYNLLSCATCAGLQPCSSTMLESHVSGSIRQNALGAKKPRESGRRIRDQALRADNDRLNQREEEE